MIKNILAKYFYLMKSVYHFFKKDSPTIHWVEHSSDSVCNELEELPKTIWMYWDSNEKNHLVDFCIHNIKTVCSDYQVNILNAENVTDYIDLPTFKEGLRKATISDYIRFALLKKYGGIWMDASTLLTENFDWFLSKMEGKENFIFYSDACTSDTQNPIVESWFIVARKHSQFIKDWFTEFEKCCLSDDPNSYYEAYKNNPVIQKIPNTDYLMCYISAAIVLSKRKYSILYANAGSVGHYYNYYLFSNSLLIAIKLFLMNKRHIFTPKLVKFTKDTRKYSNVFLKKNMVKQGTVFYKYLDK